ncbi:MAG: hypothetical protein R6T78_04675 [Dehalococcoidales bacterium]
MSDSHRVGEVIEASSTEFTAQCYELYGSPPLGSLIRTGDNSLALYGVVYQSETTSLEPGRRPIARGRDEDSEEAVYRSNPQLLKLLKSEFRALVVGHRQDGKTSYYLPPQPARIHGFVYPCSPEEIRDFGQSLAFLSILINATLPISTEELTGATLRQISREQDDPRRFLVSAGKELALLIGSNLNQLNAILGRIRP